MANGHRAKTFMLLRPRPFPQSHRFH